MGLGVRSELYLWLRCGRKVGNGGLWVGLGRCGLLGLEWCGVEDMGVEMGGVLG